MREKLHRHDKTSDSCSMTVCTNTLKCMRWNGESKYNNNNNNNNLLFIMRLKQAMQTQKRRSLHIGKIHDQHLEACCRGTILNSHRVIGIATNTSMVLNCALVAYGQQM